VARSGDAATVVTYGAGVDLAVRACDGLDVEVLDLRTVWPLDEEAVLDSVARTSRLLVLQEASAAAGVGGNILGLVARLGFEDLDAPPALVAAPDTPVPFAPELEDAYLPSVERVRAAVEALLEY
jgi:acetoin:2,6-dichlorophenolindophenol oxidoreductase subunit beta